MVRLADGGTYFIDDLRLFLGSAGNASCQRVCGFRVIAPDHGNDLQVDGIVNAAMDHAPVLDYASLNASQRGLDSSVDAGKTAARVPDRGGAKLKGKVFNDASFTGGARPGLVCIFDDVRQFVVGKAGIGNLLEKENLLWEWFGAGLVEDGVNVSGCPSGVMTIPPNNDRPGSSARDLCSG